MPRSKFGDRFSDRTKGLAGYFGQPFIFVGYEGDGWSGVVNSQDEEFRGPIEADHTSKPDTPDVELAGARASMQTMLSVHDHVFELRLDQPELQRLPTAGDCFLTPDEAISYEIVDVLDEENSWVICGCTIGG